MRNFIFISPHFPTNYENFCVQLHENGVNVFGIGDTPYENLTDSLKTALTEYYKVDSMEDYDQMYRAVAFLCYKHGSMDGLESNNEYWLEQDARLRTDFNIPGMKTADMEHVKYKSKMKPYYAKAGIPTARYHLVTDLTESLAFVEKVGYPVIVKPDNGVGATTTYKLKSEDELRAFHEEDFHGVQFIMEEFVPGEIYSYDAIMNSKGEPIFETGNHTPISIMDSVNNHDETVVLLSHKKPDGHINVKVEFGEGEGKVPLDNIAKRAESYKPKERVTYKMIKEYIEAKYGFKVHTAYIAEVKRDLGLPMYDAPNAVEELKQPRKHPTVEKVVAIKVALKHFEVI